MVVGVFAGLLSIAHPVAATTLTENFDSYQTGKLPCTTPTFVAPCQGNVFALSTSGSGSFQVTSNVKDGATGNSFQISNGNNAFANFKNTGDLCNLRTG